MQSCHGGDEEEEEEEGDAGASLQVKLPPEGIHAKCMIIALTQMYGLLYVYTYTMNVMRNNVSLFHG